MALKNLLVAYNGNEASQSALEVAVVVARKYGAHITGLHVRQPAAFDSHFQRWLPEEAREVIESAERSALEEVQAHFWSHLRNAGLDGDADLIVEQGWPNAVLAQFGRFSDLVLTGQFFQELDDERFTVDPEYVVLRGGRPVLIVPRGFRPRPLREEAVVAWDGSREVARALSDAMQILESKALVKIVTVGSQEPPETGQGLNIHVHLERHGIRSEHVHLESSHGDPGAAVLRYCRETEPDLLVMGAYSHAKIRETVLGGATRTVLQRMAVPTLMSH